MMRTLVFAALCCAVTATAGEGKAAATTAEASAKSMTCGEFLKTKAAMPSKMSELLTAAEGFFDASAEDLAPLKSKEAKAEATVMKKQAKVHKDAAAKVKMAAEEMEKGGGTLTTAVPNHPPMSDKTKAAMTVLMEKEKELVAMMQKDLDEHEKMMKDSGAKAGGSR